MAYFRHPGARRAEEVGPEATHFRQFIGPVGQKQAHDRIHDHVPCMLWVFLLRHPQGQSTFLFVPRHPKGFSV